MESINSLANVLGVMKIHKRGLVATTPGNGRDKDIRSGKQERTERANDRNETNAERELALACDHKP